MGNEYQSGINLRSPAGAAGETPYIGPNGNWWIGSTDTGVKAEVTVADFISPDAQDNDVLKYDATEDLLVPSGATSPNDGEMKLATNSLYLGSAHSLTSAGRNVTLRNIFASEVTSPVTALVDVALNPLPTWRQYTDSGTTVVVIESVATDILVNPSATFTQPFNRRLFTIEFTPAETVPSILFEIFIGVTQVWRAFVGPCVAGVTQQFDMASYSTPIDLKSSDTTFVKFTGKFMGNALTGKAASRAWYRLWQDVPLASSADITAEALARTNADNAEVTARSAAITAEALARTNADNAEATARTNADNAEITARIAGDASTLVSANAYTDSHVIAPQAPIARTLALSTAYQASSATKPAFISVMVEATYTVTLASAQSDTMELVIGPTAAVATGTGTSIATWRSGLTGIALTIGLASIDRGQLAAMLPVGWFFAVRRTAGTAAIITSAFDQSLRN